MTPTTVKMLAISAQENAAWHAAQATRARHQGNLELARHMQRLARLEFDNYWQHMVALLAVEPII